MQSLASLRSIEMISQGRNATNVTLCVYDYIFLRVIQTTDISDDVAIPNARLPKPGVDHFQPSQRA